MNNQPTPINPIIKTTYFALSKSKIILKLLPPNKDITITAIKLKQRNSMRNCCFPFKVSSTKVGNRTYYKAILDVSLYLNNMELGFWDIWVEAKDSHNSYTFILNKLSAWRKIKLILFPRWTKTDDGHLIYPFINNARQFTIQYRRYQKKYDSYLFLIKEYLALLCYYILKPYWDKKKLWLVCEKFSSMAQDNAYYFFKYCMDNLPDEERKHIFYVIDSKCPDAKVLAPYQDNVIQFMSFKYMIWLCAAQYLISTDAIRHFYIWDSPNSVYKVLYQIRKHLVFLQHGVMGFKHCHDTYKKSSGNSVALFVTCSEYEKNIIKKHFEYNDNEIIVTGLPRWDVLKSTSSLDHKEILIMPTWRKWLEDSSDEVFTESDYYKNYKELLTNTRLHTLLEEHNVTLNFYLHPKFKSYIDKFYISNQHIHIISFNQQPLNQLLMSCNMLITDYSSVAWDVFYQEKPVVFYAFDFETYNQHQGSYIDLRSEAFGDLVMTVDELLDTICKYINNDFKEIDSAVNKRNFLLPLRDNNNSKRIYDILKNIKLKSKFKTCFLKKRI